jgi:hypothetical protein
MTINQNNFEAYLLDYLEGNLNPLLTADLMAFLTENPEFEKYLPDYDSRISISNPLEYTQKNHLKKDFADIPEITTENFDEFCIAACEGLLKESELNRIARYISGDADRQNNMALIRKLKLQPDSTILFTGKSRLKKSLARSPALRYLYYAVGLAASVAFIIMLAVSRHPATPIRATLPVNTAPSTSSLQIIQDAGADEALAEKQTRVQPKRARSSEAVSITSPAADQQPEPFRETIAMTLLNPITKTAGASNIEIPSISQQLSLVRPGQSLSVKSSAVKSADSFTGTFLGSLIAKVNLWKTAETAIQGFNYLTETQLSIDKTTDEGGKLTGLLLGMESYAITGNKIK